MHYAARRRRGEPISTAFVESAVNEIVAKCMNKKQPMRWNRATVQPFLDVRTAVLETCSRTPSAIATLASGPPTMTTVQRQPRRDYPPPILNTLSWEGRAMSSRPTMRPDLLQQASPGTNLTVPTAPVQEPQASSVHYALQPSFLGIFIPIRIIISLISPDLNGIEDQLYLASYLGFKS